MNSRLRFAVIGFAVLTLWPLQAQLTIWTGEGATGSWTDLNNWSNGVPTSTTNVVFNSDSLFPSANLPAATTIGRITVDASNVTLTGTNSTFNSSSINIRDTGTLTLVIPAGGVFTSTSASTSYIGDSSGSGVLNITGAGEFSVPNSGNGVAVGLGGVGTVNQTNGTVNDQSGLWIGGDGNTSEPAEDGLGGTGVYNISGTSTLTAAFIEVGLGSTTGGSTPSSGLLEINGGSVTAVTLTLGEDDTNAVVGTGTISNTTGAVVQTAGNLTVTTMQVGQNPGAVDTYQLSESGILSATTLIIGNMAGSSGNFIQYGGTGTVTSFIIGDSGSGSGSMTGGLLTVNNTGSMTIGDAAGSSGAFTESGGTVTLNGTSNLVVGNAGVGGYGLSGGKLVVGGALNVGTSTGLGVFTLSGSGEVDATGGITVGGSTGTGVFNYSGGTIGSTTAVTVESNGSFNQNGGSFTPTDEQIMLNTGGVYNLNAGTLSIGGDIEAPGSGILASSGAIFNFAGGTVQTSSAWTDELNGSISGNSTINTAGGDATLSGTLTGSGTLTVSGGGNLNLNSDNHTASWGVNVQNGAVNVLATQFPNAGNVTLASTGTFSVTTAGTGTNVLAGSMSGTGAYKITFSGAPTFELTGPVNLGGTTTLIGGGGKLLVGTGTFGTITQSGGVSGLEVGGSRGSGVVTITNAATYTGATTVDSGYKLLASNLNSSAGNVTINGAIGSSVALTGLSGAPTLTIGNNTAGTLNSSGGTLIIRMFNGYADEVDVTGAGTTTIGAVTLGTAPETGTYTIVETAAPGDLTPYAPRQIGSNRFITVTVETSTMTTNQDLELIATASPTTSLTGLVLTPNEQSVANTLNALIVNPSSLKGIQATAFYNLLNAVGPNGTPNAQLASNIEQLTPESLQYAPTIAYENTTFMVQNLNNFETNIHHNFQGFDTSGVGVFMPGFDSGLGHELQGMLASFHDSAPNGVNYYPSSDGSISDESPTPTPMPSTPEPSHEVISDSPPVTMSPRDAAHAVNLRDPSNHFTEFLGGDVTLANLNQSQTDSNAPSSKAHYTSGDGIAGIGYHMTSNLTAGILMDYNHTDAKTDTYGSHTRVDSYSPGLWASYGEKGFFANGLFSVGVNSYDNQRVIPVVNETATSNPGGEQYVGDLDLGYEFHPAFAWTLAPTLGLTYTHIDVDSFTENGAYPADLSVNAQHDDSFRSRLGGYVTYLTHPGQVTLQPTFTAMWQHEYLDQSAQLTSQFNDFPGGAFTINSVTVGRDSALIGGGLTATFDNSMALFLNATADIGSNYDAENLVAGFKGSF